MKASLVVVVIFSLLCCGCASIITGSTDNVTYTSKPSGALVVVDGHPVGNTPCWYATKRSWGSGHVIMKIGGQIREAQVPRVFNGWFVANAAWGIVGGGIGVIIDLATGNVRKTPDGTTIHCDFGSLPLESMPEGHALPMP